MPIDLSPANFFEMRIGSHPSSLARNARSVVPSRAFWSMPASKYLIRYVAYAVSCVGAGCRRRRRGEEESAVSSAAGGANERATSSRRRRRAVVRFQTHLRPPLPSAERGFPGDLHRAMLLLLGLILRGRRRLGSRFGGGADHQAPWSIADRTHAAPGSRSWRAQHEAASKCTPRATDGSVACGHPPGSRKHDADVIWSACLLRFPLSYNHGFSV